MEGTVGWNHTLREDLVAVLSREFGPGDQPIAVLSVGFDTALVARRASAPLCPWSPQGYLVHHWRASAALAVSGLEGMVLFSLDGSRARQVIEWQTKEVSSIGPWFLEPPGGGLLYVATRDRVVAVNDDFGVTWTWWARELGLPFRIPEEPLVAVSHDVVVTACDGRNGELTSVVLDARSGRLVDRVNRG